MRPRRILITGLSSTIGGRVAQLLERRDDVAAIIGVDTEEPRHELQRTEFVRVQNEYALLRRIIGAVAIDTVVDTRMIADALQAPLGVAHHVNVVETSNLLAACSDQASSVRKLVFKSSAHYYGCARDDPAFFSEEMARRHPPRSAVERDVVEGEGMVRQFAARNRGTSVAVLRMTDAIGTQEQSSQLALLSMPVIPSILGFDPRCQYIHEDDVVGALVHSVLHEVEGVYNVAADGVLALSEVASLLGKPMLPLLPPWGTGFAAEQLRRLGLRVPVEMVRQLRYGRGLDNRRLKAAGFSYRYTSREAVLKLRAEQRLRPLLRSGTETYRYVGEVEEFLRWSPSVQAAPAAERGGSPSDGALRSLEDLSATELLEVISSLEPDGLAALRTYEQSHRARPAVLEAVDRRLARLRQNRI